MYVMLTKFWPFMIPLKYSISCKSQLITTLENLMYYILFISLQYVETVEIESTELRRNPLYYKIYCIGLNTLMSSAFPLISLCYLNIYTILGKQNCVSFKILLRVIREILLFCKDITEKLKKTYMGMGFFSWGWVFTT